MSGKEQSFGYLLRSLRKSRHLTQSELAGDEYSKSYISQLERDTAVPSLKALRYLSRRLGVSPLNLIAPETAIMHAETMRASLAAARGAYEEAADSYSRLFQQAANAGLAGFMLHCGVWTGGLERLLGRYDRSLAALTAAEKTLSSYSHTVPCNCISVLMGLTMNSLGMYAQAVQLLSDGIAGWTVTYPGQLYWFAEAAASLTQMWADLAPMVKRALAKQVLSTLPSDNIEEILLHNAVNWSKSDPLTTVPLDVEFVLFLGLREKTEELIASIRSHYLIAAKRG